MEPKVDYPPPPWHLKGTGIINLQTVSSKAARIPAGAQTLSILPGKTLGGIYLARYAAGSTLEYGELIVFSSTIRVEGRIGGYVSNIYVDSKASMCGGREIWGLPKELADFEWGADEVVVRSGAKTIVRVLHPEAAGGVRLAAPLPAFGDKCGALLHFIARCSANIRPSPADFQVPRDSPMSHFGMGRGWSFALNDLQSLIPAPESRPSRVSPNDMKSRERLTGRDE